LAESVEEKEKMDSLNYEKIGETNKINLNNLFLNEIEGIADDKINLNNLFLSEIEGIGDDKINLNNLLLPGLEGEGDHKIDQIDDEIESQNTIDITSDIEMEFNDNHVGEINKVSRGEKIKIMNETFINKISLNNLK